MPKEPIDPAEQSIGDGFQNLVTQPKNKTPRGVWVIVGLAIIFALIAFGIAGFIVFEAVMAKRHNGEVTPAVASASPSTSISPTATAAAETPKKTETPVAQSSGTAVSGNSPAVSSDSKEEEDTRKEVLTRVDLMHNLSEKEKDQLYAQIEHLITYLQKPDYQKLYEDPTVVFVVAGYADKQGNEGQNMEISKQRAQVVAKILETQAKIANTIRAVGLGGSEFFGQGTPDKNRVVEIWLAAP